MRVLCLGGGPAGLYVAISMKRRDPAHDITVVERNRPYDTFGWGVVLSDETLDNLEQNDPVSAAIIRRDFAYWDDIAVHYRGTVTRSSGHGFSGIGRKRLLQILQHRARELGVRLEFEIEVKSLAQYPDYDLIVASDGGNSTLRGERASVFKPAIEVRSCKYTWLGTHQRFDDAFTFIFEETPAGWIWVHAYQFDAETATFIVECSEATWRGLGFDTGGTAETIAICERIFARHLAHHRLLSNAAHLKGNPWLNFRTILCETWSDGRVVLLGDAAATAHFSIGSGTKLALESAIELADCLQREPNREAALKAYEAARRLEVLRLQNAARNSTAWFEEIERYLHLDPVQFNYSLLTRSQRISHENLRVRDKAWLEQAESWFDRSATGAVAATTMRVGVFPGAPTIQRAPMFVPFRLRETQLANRIVVSPMAQYKAVDGTPTDWHLVHYGERAKGGAGMVTTEMTCVTPEGRITQGCTGMYSAQHEQAWRRIVDFVHAETIAKFCLQLGHSGAKGSTQVGWDEMDAPLADGNWGLISASSVAWSPRNAVPRAMTRDDMDTVRDAFAQAAAMADRAGFDCLELHCAHGYLLSAFITPLTNQRTDAYGGSLANRMRYPLEVFHAVRAVWPAAKPISVRISATDWVGADGIQPADAVGIGRLLSAAGVDIIDVSAGQTSANAKPVYGRMFQTPFSDRIRNEARVATMAVGNITEPDHVNSILMAGRADLVCIGRPHLADPYWTLHAAAALGHQGAEWPKPYHAGRDQLYRLRARPDVMTGPTSTKAKV